MKLQKIWAGIFLSGLLVGCGGTSTPSGTDIDLPDGNVLIFFDNNTTAQYLYDTDSETFEDMNSDPEKNYDMTQKHGKLIVWNHHTDTGIDPKIVMLQDDFTIVEGNLTHEDFHYLGHFHEDNETNETIFAAHSAVEFDTNDTTKLEVLDALNFHLAEQEEIRVEIRSVLPGEEVLCNFFVFDHIHEESDTNETEEVPAPHIALTESGMVYIYTEEEGVLVPSQSPVVLDGVTKCQENESSIIQNGDHGLFIFSAQSQKLYVVDSHDGSDFHVHSSFGTGSFLPAGFTPTNLAGIGEGGEHDHDH